MSILQENDFDNKLSGESSPYLKQHVHNPVNWYPWGPVAIEQARKHDKPILLSIGYSSCHWCHVMMHESFCDPEVAATMNRLFINVKVDREERPDLDKIYQTAYQLLMGKAGGWPLTLFVSPTSLLPYYGGTYFSKEANDEVADFSTILHRLNEVYYRDKEKIQQQELHTMAILQVMTQYRPAQIAPLAKDLIHKAEVALQREFDPAHGGFGEESKFPNCPNLEFILHSQDTMTRHIALTTLDTMANSGLYDQLSGGFFRYTVDSNWQIPHFEKVLYDNAQLIQIYAHAFHITNHAEYKTIALETASWLKNTLFDSNTDAFYNAIDADSEDQEGLYYIWDTHEIKKILRHEEYAAIKKYYQLDHHANFEKKWHLIINPKAEKPNAELLQSAKQKLLTHRSQRVMPELDTLIITSNNALLIKALSIAAELLDQPELAKLAENIINFIHEKMYIDNKLYSTWQIDTVKIPAFLDDYAFLLDAILTFIHDDIEHELYKFCIKLADDLIDNFYDSENGGFYFTSNDAEKLFYRPKTFTDDAIPSGNGIACLALLKLGKLSNNDKYIDAAKQTINSALIYLNEAPDLHLTMCNAYAELHLIP
jgi:uncharacterized protein YyaL (SSP411 family)